METSSAHIQDTLLHLLDAAGRLPSSQPALPTYLELAGCAHLENVASNVLQFCLQPDAAHELGTLFLDVLLGLLPEPPAVPVTAITVTREATTPEGYRIDLVIETEAFVLGIENKIFHAIDNPFAAYGNHLSRLAAGRPIYCVLLALQLPVPLPDIAGFVPITYRLLLNRLRPRLDQRLPQAPEPYRTFVADFVQTLERLNGPGGVPMDTQLLAFFRDRRTDIETLLGEVSRLRTMLRSQLTTLHELLVAAGTPLTPEPLYWRPPEELYDVLGYQVKASSTMTVQININVSPSGWLISLFNFRGSREELRSWLVQHHIETWQRDTVVWRLGHGVDLPYDAPLAQVQEQVQGLLQKAAVVPVSN